MTCAVQFGRWVWLPTPRAASSSIEWALVSAGGRRLTEAGPHPKPGDLPPLSMITVIRSPWEVVSSWWHAHGGERTAAEFIEPYEHSHFCRDERLLYYRPVADVVLRFEDGIEQALSAILGTRLLLPRLHVTTDKLELASVFDKAAVAAMLRRFGGELAELGHYGYGGQP